MKKRIVVTQDDIDNGKPRRSGYCAVARAAKRALGFEQDRPNIYVTGKQIEDRFGKVIATLPEKVIDFIGDYDGEVPVKPFTFTAEVTL